MNIRYQDELGIYQNWWLTRLLIGASGLLVASWIVIAVLALKAPLPPYLAVADTSGKFVATGQPVAISDVMIPSVTRSIIEDYIERAFRIEYYDDQQRDSDRVFNMSSPDSAGILKAFYAEKANDPIGLGAKFRQSVKFISFIKLPGQDDYESYFETIRTPLNEEDGVTTKKWHATLHFLVARGHIYMDHLHFEEESN